jgi:hypothetical protein
MGYLKTLYQQKDAQNRDGEGMMQVMRLAKEEKGSNLRVAVIHLNEQYVDLIII